MNDLKNILISRTDAIGDVILTLPVAKVLKEAYPDAKVHFLGKSYTKEVVACYQYVDNFINFNELEQKSDSEFIDYLKKLEIDTVIHVFPNKRFAALCKKAKILNRIGTSSRVFHWWTCNKLIKLSRKSSDLHEAQLNLKLLKGLVPKVHFSINELNHFDGFNVCKEFKDLSDSLIDPTKKNIILHPRSHGSAKEWGLKNFEALINKLFKEGGFNIIITGTEVEGNSMRDFLNRNSDKVHDTTGLLSLAQLTYLISKSDALIAASTGPLHIASALGINCIGLFIMARPMHPGRWKPIGNNSHYLVHDQDDTSLDSIQKISTQKVFNKLCSILRLTKI